VHSRVTRVPSLAMAIGGIAIVAAGCSASSSTPSSSAASGGAAKPASATTATARQALLLTSKTEQSDKSLDATITVQGSTSSGSLSMDGTLQEQIHPSVLAEFNVSSLTTAGQSISGGFGEIITPSAVYLRFPELMKAEHISKPWAEFQLSALGASGSTLQSPLSQLQASSPGTQSAELATSTDAHKVSTGTIDGVPVTEYAGSYSISQALAALPASERSALGTAISASGVKTCHFEIWIDGSNQARKIVVTEAGTALSETITMNVTSYNQPVNIGLPTAAQTYVIPASQLGTNG
jgi:hypothetical protein